MSNQDLEILRNLAREQASEGFTEAVLLRARNVAALPGRSRTTVRRGLRWALATCALVLALSSVAAFLGHRARHQTEHRRSALAELARIKSEQRQVARQIRSLRRAAEPTIVYLGGDRDHDFVVDVGRLVDWARDAKTRTGGHDRVQPSGNDL
ncbi:MAG TPA: hypothetical protein VKA53_11005 [Thermoanaerobaculia bacterium]|nr:hypothetical protein [Thermoanaerobaculia bacterium]